MLPILLSLVRSDENRTFYSFKQTLDHENTGSETFDQYYYEVTDHVVGQPKAIIVKIGAESDKLVASGVSDFNAVLAKRYNAIVLTIQHRFFGKSIPQDGLTVDKLKFLTVEQAVQDYKVFHDYYQNEKKLNLPWLVVGGSYPGLLSALIRDKYPDDFKAAISSSGVLYATNNFVEFDLQDAISMGQECAAIARQTRYQIEKLLEDPSDKAYVMNLFGVDTEKYPLKDGEFMNFIGELFTLSLQYNNLSKVCSPLVNARRLGYDTVSALATYAKGWFYENQAKPQEYSTAHMRNITGPNNDQRCWFWMTCNQLAYWQIGKGRLSLRGEKVTKEVFEDQCKDVFDQEMHPDVDAFNAKYSGIPLNRDHIFYTTASQDPWTWTCVTEDVKVNENSVVRTYAGPELGHCSDLDGATDNDPEDLVRIREQEILTIEHWLFDQ
ncbi:Clan SC, family S28, unassigned serine peptidase [Trichomonas vaginalis G3]|uniref:Clan SC, family S28, unassigned serine peptidase n=1 Tax=Trichomonas vaginalis (strain ATCC PRA-98 / G3) TaxID=412133 RepID=A2E983_TRIV3|nr:serine-type peptidase protein [Trichomonas vaginalis G3]EAY10768.1 Clan SC, family S28, unassigned serine peptidase [Trichomonas vaginalis G3]KAI5536094.1 serine-type peptidase protein [Trichomonas vaginalis G3]|eukprot:XP_001322991.1 Clan SC, family S28, unassigned serine peptidase [Trichomonas vaginalis G3]